MVNSQKPKVVSRKFGGGQNRRHKKIFFHETEGLEPLPLLTCLLSCSTQSTRRDGHISSIRSHGAESENSSSTDRFRRKAPKNHIRGNFVLLLLIHSLNLITTLLTINSYPDTMKGILSRNIKEIIAQV